MACGCEFSRGENVDVRRVLFPKEEVTGAGGGVEAEEKGYWGGGNYGR